MVEDPQKCLELLSSHNIQYTLYEHPAMNSIDDAGRAPAMRGLILKNLVLTNKNRNFYLFSAPLTSRVNLKLLSKELGEPRFSFADEADLQELQLRKGHVSPLSLVNDSGKRINFVRAAELDNYELVNCHPLNNSFSIDIRLDDLDFMVQQVFGHTLTKIRGCIVETN